MAAAYNLPPIADDNPNPQIITITNGAASPATCKIANGQGVTFNNNSGSPISVYIEPDVQGVTVFSSPIPVGANSSATVYPQALDRTVNFNTDGSQGYPYAIQVGGGPLYISVVVTNTGVINVTPSPAVIPAGGTWRLYKASGDNNTYNVTWPGIAAPPFPNFTVNNTTQTAGVTTTGYVAYKVQLGDRLTETTGHGGGTIKVGGN
jgi:hypothetical protein